ncbi:MAG: hypothetical protein AUJ71_03905 [Candidatus Omnitrophica bacterium CG1_02_49_16]|nr:MAG: hypothetical protein AUJ71_03905 [Candidatus Omnitrophica bacterium CG1_02_49_16]
MSLKKILVKDTMQYSIANYISMGVGIFLSIASKAILGTLGAGYWAVMKIFLTYSAFADLGVRDAGLREMTQAAGAADEITRIKIKNQSFTFTLFTAFFASLTVVVISIFGVKDPFLKNCLYVVALLVVATQLYNFMLTIFRAEKNIGTLSRIIVLNILFVAFFALTGAQLAGAFGFAAGTFVATALSAYFAYRMSRDHFHFEIDGKSLWKLVTIGFPLIVAGYALDTFLGVDSIMIGKMLGIQSLGLYTIALMAVQQINSLGRFSQIVLMPHIQERYGQAKSLVTSKALLVRSTSALMHLLPFMIGFVYFAVPVVVYFFLPRFQGGLPSMKILVVGYFFVAVNEMSTTILFTVNKQKYLIPLFAAMTVVAIALNFFFIRMGYGLEGVAVATSVAYFCYFLALFFYGFGQLLDRRELIAMTGKTLFVFFYFAGTLFAVDKGIRTSHFIAGTAVKTVLYLLILSPLLWKYEREEGLFKMVFDIIRMRRI